MFGFLGPNGAGKSTAIRALLGFLRPTSGEATLLGKRVADRHELVEVKRELGHIPGDFAFYDSSVAVGSRLLRALRGGERRTELSLFPAPFDRKVGTYSRGNRQKLAIVQAFMHDPTSSSWTNRPPDSTRWSSVPSTSSSKRNASEA